MKKTEKGQFGYIKYEKKKRILMTAGLFTLPLLIFLTGLWQTGTRKNMFTFVAIMGCLPAAKCAVSMILICMQKSLDPGIYEEMKKHVKDMTVLYESTVSSYEKNISLPCIVISGLNVVCYTDDPKVDASFAENHMKKILQGNGLKANVRIFHELKPFYKRLDEIWPNHKEMEENLPYRPDERYPNLTRNELVMHVLMAISV